MELIFMVKVPTNNDKQTLVSMAVDRFRQIAPSVIEER